MLEVFSNCLLFCGILARSVPVLSKENAHIIEHKGLELSKSALLWSEAHVPLSIQSHIHIRGSWGNNAKEVQVCLTVWYFVEFACLRTHPAPMASITEHKRSENPSSLAMLVWSEGHILLIPSYVSYHICRLEICQGGDFLSDWLMTLLGFPILVFIPRREGSYNREQKAWESKPGNFGVIWKPHVTHLFCSSIHICISQRRWKVIWFLAEFSSKSTSPYPAQEGFI